MLEQSMSISAEHHYGVTKPITRQLALGTEDQKVSNLRDRLGDSGRESGWQRRCRVLKRIAESSIVGL